MNAIFPPLSAGLMKISRSHFKQSKNPLLILRSYVGRVFCKFLGDFWICLGSEKIVVLKGFVKFREIRNIEDLIANLSPKKFLGLQRDSNPWPLR